MSISAKMKARMIIEGQNGRGKRRRKKKGVENM